MEITASILNSIPESDLTPVMAELREEIGAQPLARIISLFGGDNLSVTPASKVANLAKRVKVRAEYDGTPETTRRLARETGLSAKVIRREGERQLARDAATGDSLAA